MCTQIGPPAVDTSGNVYVITGNGYNGTGYDGVHNFSESILKLDPAAGLALKDWFTPSSWLTLDNQDLDLTSSGPMLVPGTSLLVGGGKTGVLPGATAMSASGLANLRDRNYVNFTYQTAF